MKIVHVEKREREHANGNVRVSALCGAEGKHRHTWRAQDARDLIRLTEEGTKPKHYLKTWKFCEECEALL